MVSFLSQLSSGDASDSICPKGWGMAKYSGDGSYGRLIAKVYGMNKMNTTLTRSYKEYNTYIRPNEIILQRDLSFLRNGSYEPTEGTHYLKEVFGCLWEDRLHTNMIVYGLDFYENYLSYHYGNGINDGHSLRCVANVVKIFCLC